MSEFAVHWLQGLQAITPIIVAGLIIGSVAGIVASAIYGRRHEPHDRTASPSDYAPMSPDAWTRHYLSAMEVANSGRAEAESATVVRIPAQRGGTS